MNLTLVSRSDCGLCLEAVRALRELRLKYDLVDVDNRPELLALYDDAVPVVLLDGRELCRAPITVSALRYALQAVNLT